MRRIGFDSESGQTNDFKISIHRFPAWRPSLKRQCRETGKLTCCAVRKDTFEAVDSGLVPSRVKLMTLKLVFTASLLGA